MATATHPGTAEVWDWLGEVPDPEIPVISLTDLGIVRDVAWDDDTLVVTVTPTYSGCPATAIINLDIEKALHERGIEKLRLERRLSPPWTTDWISAEGRDKLRAYGIAPPVGLAATQSIAVGDIGRTSSRRAWRPPGAPAGLACPQCGSTNVQLTSQFGSTPCKASYRCDDCLEPFDYFKCI